MKIGNFDLAQEVLVIAEIGNNHEGDFALASEMIYAAASTGAQAVKFQTILPEKLVSAPQVARLEQLNRFAFSQDQFSQLADIAHKAGVMFMSTPFAPDVVSWLDNLVPAFKIASGDNNYDLLLKTVAAKGKPILLSTGMAGLPEINHACAVIESAWPERCGPAVIMLLHCVSAYPTLPEQAQLLAITTLAREIGRPVGYSDHTLGIDAAVLSVALGARAIEKHFTLSKSHSDFRDHALSADPQELTELVQQVRQAQLLLGVGGKIFQEVEKATAAGARRSIVAGASLPIGHVLTWEDLDWLRPGGGLLPGQEDLLLGRRLIRSVEKGEMLFPEGVS